MRIFVCVWLSLLLLGSHLCKAEDINVFSKDTVWVVNYQYSPLERDTFHFNLPLPKRDDFPEFFKNCPYVRIFWGVEKGGVQEHSDVISVADLPDTFSYKYPTGSYPLRICYYKNEPTDLNAKADTTVRLQIFNQNLLGHISLQGTPGCIERGVDTFYVKMTDHRGNPPGTQYAVEVRTDAPPKEGFWKVSPEGTDLKDSATVVFSGPTGTFGADIRFRMTYKESSTSTRLKTNTTEWKTTYVYQKPNIREIFSFRDTLIKGEDIESFKKIEICTNEEMTEMDYDSLMNVRYTYSDNLPMYRSRSNFKVDYYRKDSIKQADWVLVTADTALVDTFNMKFKYPGFYKIKMYAENVCGVDSLSTDSIKGYNDKRYIQVYQGGTNIMKCEQDTICSIDESGVKIVFKDLGRRYDWDPNPQYTFGITKTLNSGIPDTVILKDPIEIKSFKNGEEFTFVNSENVGCDSTYLSVILREPGTYKVCLTRSRFCNPPVEFTHTIVIGKVPHLSLDSLYKSLDPLYTTGLAVRKCGIFDYILPDIPCDTNNMFVDSVLWCFNKKDTLFRIHNTEQVYKFDSLGNHANYVTLKVRNYCGWSDNIEAELYTHIRPDMTLWRDSLPINDSLCVGLSYQYNWKGTFPENYDIWGRWSEKVTVNEETVNISDESLLATETDTIGILQFNKPYPKVYETFTIRNSDYFDCMQLVVDSVHVLARPTTVSFDTIRHCEDFKSLNTAILFENESPQFKYVEWKYNEELLERKSLKDYGIDIILSSNDIDSLYVKTANSKGCYIEKKIVFEPQKKPDIILHKGGERCTIDTIFAEDYLSALFVQNTNIGVNKDIYCKIYQESILDEMLLFDTNNIHKVIKDYIINHDSKDTIRLIYALKNNRVTPGFGDCTLKDTLFIKTWNPILDIRGCDTLFDISLEKYDFANIKASVKIDTNDIKNKVIKWSCVNGDGVFTNAYDLKTDYKLGSSDKKTDSLIFILTGYSRCDKLLTDSLIVYLPKEKLYAHTDTICIDNQSYLLWGPEKGKTSGKYINLGNLEWNLLKGKNGEEWGNLSSHQGVDVVFTPNKNAWKADTVKIEVKAWNTYDEFKTKPPLKDTIFLKVNHIPVNIYPDTLYLKAQSGIMYFQDIKVFKNGYTSINDAYSVPENTLWTPDETAELLFNPLGMKLTTSPGEDNSYTKLSLTISALKGCMDLDTNIVVVGVVEPEVKLNNFDLCDENMVRVSTGYTLKGQDNLTKLRWSHNGNGKFDDSFDYYAAGVNDMITSLKLEVVKKFTIYNGILDSLNSAAQSQVHLYKKPILRLTSGDDQDYDYDTLCLNTNTFEVRKDWILANFSEGNFSQDNLIFAHSIGLAGDFNNGFTLDENVDEALFVVSTDFGNCTRWINLGDTLRVTRLKKMTGNFRDPDNICIGGSFIIKDISIDSKNNGYFWTQTGGNINQIDPIQPIFTSNRAGAGSVTLNIIPPHECPVEKIKSATFLMVEPPPALSLTNRIICRDSDVDIDFTRHQQVHSIAWKANGRLFATTTSESTVHYTFDSQDVVDGIIEIVAEITPESPCSEIIRSNTMLLTIQESPVVIGNLIGDVCQGDTLNIVPDIVDIANAGAIQWELNGSKGSLESLTELNTRYFPGEISGNQSLLLTVQGLNGCANVSETINILVNKAPVPKIEISEGPVCVGTQIDFRSDIDVSEVGSAGKWYIDDVEKSSDWNFDYIFEIDKSYKITFTTTYNNICPRSWERQISVNPLPEVDFSSQPDSIVGSGKEITFTNHTPGTITDYKWNFQGKGTEISDENGAHTRRFDLPSNQSHDMIDVTLTVTNGNQCTNFKTDRIKVVGKPIAKFEISDRDTCSGEMTFNNVSIAENATFLWEMGNGQTVEDTIPKDFTYVPVLKDSVYYIKLTVENEAGTDEFMDTVKIISLLKPKFITGPSKTECEKQDIAFSNRTQGDADTYTFSWGDGLPDEEYKVFFPSPILHKYFNESNDMKKFYITLTATNTCHTESYKDTVLVYPNAFQAAFLPDITRACFGSEIHFTNESVGFGPDAQAQWLFEGINNPIKNNNNEVIHRFNKPGQYPVRLVMTDRCNTDTSDMVNIRILGDLSLDFSIEEGPYCSGQKIEMKVVPEARKKFTGYHWDFEDGYPNTENVDSLKQKYTVAGDYNVKLTANSLSEGNCPITTKGKPIKIEATPFADINSFDQTPLSGCAPYLVRKISRVGIGNELIFWNLGNGETSTERTVDSIRYPDAGEYTVKLRLTSAEGCVDSAAKKIVVKKTPLPSFEVSDTLFCTPAGGIQIGLQNKTPEPNLSSFEWFYNEQLFSRNENPEALRLNMIGEINIALRATNPATGCSAKTAKKIISGRAFRLNLELDTLFCDEEPVAMKSLNEDAQEILWDLGDGTKETQLSFTHVYPEPGQYTLKINGGNETGCTDTVIKTITVYPVPHADYFYAEDHMAFEELKFPEGVDISKLPDIKNGIIRFTNTSMIDKYDFSTGNTTAIWDFGDASPLLSSESPTHRFPNNGSYEVKLMVRGDHGCADSLTQLIAIDLVKGLFIPNAFAPGTDKNENPGLALFQPKGIGLLSYKVQVFDEWGTCVWSSNKLQEGRPAEAWDGTFNGQVLPKGVYTWKVDAIFLDGTVWEGERGKTNGRVIIIR